MRNMLSGTVQKIFGLSDTVKDAVTPVKEKISRIYGTLADNEGKETQKNIENGVLNPFLKKDGSLVNPYINYQKVLDNPNVSNITKDFITKATNFTPTSADNNNIQTSSYKEYTDNQSRVGGVTVKVNSSDGIFKNPELLGIIKRVSKETSVPANVLLAVAQQETNGKWYDSVPDGTGKSYGYMMLYDNGVIADLKAKGKSELAEKAKVDPYTNVLVGAQYLKQFYEQTGNWQSAATRYNGSGTAAQKYGATVWNRANSQAYIDAANSLNFSSGYSGSSSNSNKLVESAKQFLGTPYVWGGESMAEGGMDCSGFIYAALKNAGYNIGRTTAQGYRSYGTKVNKSDMQAGDLIFFGKGDASHIGIYLGNGQMIHSSGGSKNTKSNPGKGVTINNVDYRSDFIEARRY